MNDLVADEQFMRRALQLARRGEGRVEPNPMVGAVLVRDAQIVGEGFHEAYGGAHAEVDALRRGAGPTTRGATLYVTLEPCCHHGKTPPCTEAIRQAAIGRVVVALEDPFARVSGEGIRQLREAGVRVDVGLCEQEARDLVAPYLKLLNTGRPWVSAKWAMTMDGKIATASGQSRWISNEVSRGVVHRLRGRMDAILVGRRTAELDDPALTARPPGPRTPTRIVLDTQASLSSESRLAKTARDVPVLLAASQDAPTQNVARLTSLGVEVMGCAGGTPKERLGALLEELGRRRMTNLLIEGGGEVLGSFLEARALDEVHVFLAPLLVGGRSAPGPLGGLGVDRLAQALCLEPRSVQSLGGDLYVHGRIISSPSRE